MAYTIRYDMRVKDDLKQISSSGKESIRKAIEAKLTTQPTLFGKPLRHSLAGFRVLRISSYRVVYLIKRSEIFILLIGDRKHVYKEALKRYI